MSRGSERSKMKIYQFSPKKKLRFQDIRLLAFFPPLFLRRLLEAIIWHPKSVPYVACKPVYIRVYHYAITTPLGADVINSKGPFKCISLLKSENCKFEIKYLRTKAILDVVKCECSNPDKCKPATPILLSQLKTNVKGNCSPSENTYFSVNFK